MRWSLVAFTLLAAAIAQGAEPATATPVQTDLLQVLDAAQADLIACNQDLWNYAELGLEEHRSAARLTGMLKKAGFKVTEGVSGMPTAFIAEYGSGKPIIGILAEFDALPELSQEVTALRKPAEGRANGHGCGHCAFGTAVVGAAIAVKDIYQKHHFKGTLRVYGCPAEETLIGKVYMALDGKFDDLDTCLHWHPSTKNKSQYGTSKAAISAKFTFAGLPSHASGSPDKGRSALDAVELMNVGTNFMREHVKDSTRVHYVITNGGQQPNVVPALATVWYYVRSDTHEANEKVFTWVRDIADGAAKMTRTSVAVKIDTDCHEVIPNLPLAKLIDRNLRLVGAPKFSEADRKLALELQSPLRGEFGLTEKKPLSDEIDELPKHPEKAMGGSTDVGDVSWLVPMGGLDVACFAAGSPGHSWQNVAAVGSPIGHKGMMVAAKTLALSLSDLLQNEAIRKEARADFDERMMGKKYTTIIPKGQPAPKSIR